MRFCWKLTQLHMEISVYSHLAISFNSFSSFCLKFQVFEKEKIFN